MTQPIALQLYSVREQLAHDFEGTIRRVAGIGFAGVETANFPAGRGTAVRFKVDRACVSCHTDIHRGALGPDCANCHRP